MKEADLSMVMRARGHGERAAVEAGGAAFTYATLLDRSARVAGALLDGSEDLDSARVGFLVEPGFAWVAVQWGIWRAGGIAVPLAVSHPTAELEYCIGDADVFAVVSDERHAETVRPLAEARGVRFLTEEQARGEEAPPALPVVPEERPALMVYTSGTTGRPKGVVTTHTNIRAQVEALIAAWGWTQDDRILLVLPLHHVHGIINVVACALWAGARCIMHPRFDAGAVWDRFVEDPPTLFMAVPTIYGKLIAAYDAAPERRRGAMSAGCARMRLMVSGSAALPVSTLERWREISGHVLLERYGMTEIGMALSNPLEGRRVPGSVGTPLPGVDVRLVDEDGRVVEPGVPGEIEVRGPSVFLEYWRREEETRSAFHDGWFKTGDVAVVDDGRYRILGRKSIDIIKTGGYKVSALEVEEVLRTHPSIQDCAVVAVPDPKWGERVCAAAELVDGADLDIDELRQWGKERLAPYKIPTALLPVKSLPRNAMGKVRKKGIASLFEQAQRVAGLRLTASDDQGGCMTTSGGSLRAIWIKRARRGPMDAVASARLEKGEGIAGNTDRGGKRQVTVIAEEAWEALQAELGTTAGPAARRANFMVRGVDLADTRERTLRIGACRIIVRGETRPCERMDEAVPGLRDAMRSDWRGGVYGEVLDSGTISVGDAVGWED